MNWEWDNWQKEVLEHDGNITLRTGRQVGKSAVISQKAADFAVKNPGTTTLIIAASQRQSGLLFEKVRGNLERDGVDFAEPPTLTRIKLKNESRIYCLPAGRTAYSIRGYSIDMLIADEAAYIPEAVWNAVIPMLAVSKKTKKFGWIVLLSTPFGKGGYFYHSFTDPDFRSWHVSSENCKRIPKDFLKKEKDRMSKMEYRQEYMGEFTEEWNQLFPTDLIKKRMTFIEWNKTEEVLGARYYLGVDIARYGGDENAFVVCEMIKDKLRIVKVFTTSRISTTDTIGRIEELDKQFNFRKVFLDDGGVGGAVTDSLQDKLGRKVMGINNASRRFEMQGEEKKHGILKEDLYSNMLMLLETEKLDLISDMDLLKSLKSITFEYGAGNNNQRSIKIFGDYSHISEAAVRACWCIKEKGLDLYVC